MTVQFMRWILCLVLIISSITVCAAQSFITIADIHFDPFASCHYFSSSCTIIDKLETTKAANWSHVFEKYDQQQAVNYFTDTNYRLLKSSLTELTRVSHEVQPEFVVILGDFLAHDFQKKFKKFSKQYSRQHYKEFVKKTMEYLTLELNAAFPDSNIYPVLGNNDSYTGNYHVDPNGSFLKDTATTWSVFIKDAYNRQQFQADFKKSGYYEIELSNSHDRIIVLNTVLFSEKSQTNSVKKAAKDQLAWLERRLIAAENEGASVVIAYHIPMGIDLMKTLKVGFSEIKKFWLSDYNDSFSAILKKHATVVSAILAGHIHIDAFQILTVKAIVPVIFTPSISPIYGNNPGFKVFDYEQKDFKLTNIRTYYDFLNLSVPSWRLNKKSYLQTNGT